MLSLGHPAGVTPPIFRLTPEHLTLSSLPPSHAVQIPEHTVSLPPQAFGHAAPAAWDAAVGGVAISLVIWVPHRNH